jgi:hypothetical protein
MGYLLQLTVLTVLVLCVMTGVMDRRMEATEATVRNFPAF